jgi:hypothetical protein
MDYGRSAAPKRTRRRAMDDDRDPRESSAAYGIAEMPSAADGGVCDASNAIGVPEPVAQQRKRKQKNKDGTASRFIHHCIALIISLPQETCFDFFHSFHSAISAIERI